MHFSAAVFDMDGLLLDSEQVSYDTFSHACSELGLAFKEQVYLSCIGTNAEQIKKTICEGYGEGLDYPRLRDCWLDKYHALAVDQALPIKQGVVDLLQWLTSQGVPLAVATSSGKPTAEAKLGNADLLHFFESVSTGCQVNNSKPHPEIFLKAAKSLNIDASKCLAFEDSENGVRAAVAAGMQVYQIPDLIQPSDELKRLGHKVRDSLSEVLLELK
ncbi:phosphatase [Agarivorans sp. OAG1]|uniref:HAD family hydrolase n=1 Tax=Agarivorans sp. OAG1 TaxID=3082387 RepID=UPI002B2FCF30|nr:phosphatase [Agarivorans sp. OAG1]